MTQSTGTNWNDVAAAAKELAGNWQTFDSFAWQRAGDLDDPDAWMLCYTSHRDSGRRARVRERIVNERLERFAQADDPDVFERHAHFAVGFVDGFSLRVVNPDGTVTEAFRTFCRLMADLEE